MGSRHDPVQSFEFMGGSLGLATVPRSSRHEPASRKNALHPHRIVGRRAHAGRHSLADADAAHHGRVNMLTRRDPYVVVLTDRPPAASRVLRHARRRADCRTRALIGFSGARHRADIRERLPKASSARISLGYGMIDMIVHRHQMKETLSRIVHC